MLCVSIHKDRFDSLSHKVDRQKPWTGEMALSFRVILKDHSHIMTVTPEANSGFPGVKILFQRQKLII